MFRRFLFQSVGVLALLVGLGTPGQLHAQGMRGGFSGRMSMPFRGNVMPGFGSGIGPRFNGGMFHGPFNGGMFNARSNAGMFRVPFNGGMFTPRSNGGMFSPRFSGEMFGPGFFRPF